jgi:hypothetical protein
LAPWGWPGHPHLAGLYSKERKRERLLEEMSQNCFFSGLVAHKHWFFVRWMQQFLSQFTVSFCFSSLKNERSRPYIVLSLAIFPDLRILHIIPPFFWFLQFSLPSKETNKNSKPNSSCSGLGVAETTPNCGLGVVSGTPLA